MFLRLLLSSFLMIVLSGCESTYYNTMEKVGFHKRDILVDRIEAVQKAQEDGKEQFSSALEQFQTIVNVDGGKLESTYKQLNSEYEDSVKASEEITTRINKVESVAEALFKEWESELSQYSNPRLKADSQSQLNNTRRQYQQLLSAMRNAEKSIKPVLTIFSDNVLYLKHNLNARAISSMKGELNNINREVDRLLNNMQQSISASDQFIKQLKN